MTAPLLAHRDVLHAGPGHFNVCPWRAHHQSIFEQRQVLLAAAGRRKGGTEGRVAKLEGWQTGDSGAHIIARWAEAVLSSVLHVAWIAHRGDTKLREEIMVRAEERSARALAPALLSAVPPAVPVPRDSLMTAATRPGSSSLPWKFCSALRSLRPVGKPRTRVVSSSIGLFSPMIARQWTSNCERVI